PCRVERVCSSYHFRMSSYRNTRGLEKVEVLFVLLSSEHPVAPADGFEVFLLDPAFGLAWMSSSGPAPECLEDGAIHIAKDFLTHYVLVIECPASDERVEQQDQVSRS